MAKRASKCAVGDCAKQAVNSEYCKDHECTTGGCSMPSNTGDGNQYCRTHECSEAGCGDQAFGNELYCISHRD
jgi:hypothetical protein